MFDVAPTELLLVGIVALLVIGPKDLPKAMRLVGKWVGRARGVARQFRAGFDAMVRESELAELEKQWAEENERIMRDHPPAQLPAPDFVPPLEDAEPVMVDPPAMREEPAEPAPRPRRRKAAPAADTSEAPKPRPRAPRAKAKS